jgi:hypothetical protein
MSGRLPTRVVLASASAMVAIGLGAFAVAGRRGPPPDDPGEELPPEAPIPVLVVDDSTAERAAHSFYDAWRRRRWDEAERLSRGAALQAVRDKRARDETLPEEERRLADQTWLALAAAPMELRLSPAEVLEGGRVGLDAVASYRFMGRPYRRRVRFLVAPDGERFVVESMVLGEVLTELPSLARGAEP